MDWYQPGAVVIQVSQRLISLLLSAFRRAYGFFHVFFPAQCGGDSLAGDKLGSLNLSMKGASSLLRFFCSISPCLVSFRFVASASLIVSVRSFRSRRVRQVRPRLRITDDASRRWRIYRQGRFFSRRRSVLVGLSKRRSDQHSPFFPSQNVARTWANETAIVLGEELDEDMPYNE